MRSLTHLSGQQCSVRVSFDSTTDDDQRKQWNDSFQRLRGLHLATDHIESQACNFHIRCSKHAGYKILDKSSQVICGFPKVPWNELKALERLIVLLEHLAIFKGVEGIMNSNRDLDFEKGYSVSLGDAQGVLFKEDKVMECRDNDIFKLTIKNIGSRVLCVHVLNLAPTWAIDFVALQGKDFWELLPKTQSEDRSQKTISLRATIPQSVINQGRAECEDTMKVFITNKSTSFRALQLKPLDSYTHDSSIPIRSSRDQLWSFHSELTTHLRGRTNVADEVWAVHNIVIRTAKR